MKGIERQYLRECIKALCKARSELLHKSCDEAISKIPYGKGDSLCLDAIPEIAITKTLCEDFDPHLPLVTEEIGSSVKLRGTEDEVICFSDPMDRSKVLAEFLSKHNEEKVETIFQANETVNEWETNYGGEVELSGPYGSITAIRHHHLLFNVMINYISGMIYIASDVGVGKLSMSEVFEDTGQTMLKGAEDLISNLQSLSFGGDRALNKNIQKKFVTYRVGKKYEDNVISSEIFGNRVIQQIRKENLKYDNPGGPARILYLQNPERCGFILSNGEKIGEWLGWLAYAKYCSRKLCAYEISFDSTWLRDKILMALGPAYSILVDNIQENLGYTYVNVKLNISKLKFLENPSRYRATILICPESNFDVISNMRIKKWPELRFEDN